MVTSADPSPWPGRSTSLLGRPRGARLGGSRHDVARRRRRLPVGLQRHRLDAHRTAVAVGDQRDVGGRGGACCRWRWRTPRRRSCRSCRCSRPRRSGRRPGSARSCTCTWPPTTRSTQPRAERLAAPRLASWTSSVATRRLVGESQTRVGEPVADLVEAEAGLVAPVAEAARARVVDPEQRRAAGAVDDLAVEHRPAEVGEVVAHEGAVVVVAGHAERSRSSNAVVQRVEAERLPRLAGRGVVAGVEDGASAPARSAIARATWSMPMLSCRSETSSTTVSPSAGSRSVEVGRAGGRLCRRTSCSCRR